MRIKLVWRNLMSHPFRTITTLGCVVVAVFVLCILRAIVGGLTSTVEQSATNRLWVQSAVSLFVDLPLAYESKISAVEGVEWVCKWQWFGGVYRDESNFFAQFGIDADKFLKSYPEISISDGSYEKFQQNRIGCLVGQDLATTYGWQIGDTIPILGRIFPRAGDEAWEFKVEAIYRSKTTAIDQKTFYFNYDYLRESLEGGSAAGHMGVGVFMLKIKPDADPTSVMAAVDLLFEKGPQRVQTTTEAEFNRQFISMLGNVPVLLSSIGGGVLFAIFFAVLNTMMMAGRERTRDIGVMKALGFKSGAMFRLLLSESLLLCVVGGLAGIGCAKAIEGGMARALAGQFPGFEIGTPVMLIGLGIAMGVGILAGLGPGVRASRLTPVEALRAEA